MILNNLRYFIFSRYRLRVKVVFITVIIFLLCAVIFTVLVNIFLHFSHKSIEQSISQYLSKKVSLGDINYSFPNRVTINKVYFPLDVTAVKNDFSIDYIEKLSMIFFVTKLVTKHKLEIGKVYLDQPKITIFKYNFLFSNDIQWLVNRVSSLVQDRTIKIDVRDALIIIARKNTLGPFIFNAVFKISKDKSILSYGNIVIGSSVNYILPKGKTENLYKNNFEYSFAGYIKRNGINIENIELKKDYCYLKLWGNLEINTLKLNGIISLGNNVKPGGLSGDNDLTSNLKRIFTKPYNYALTKNIINIFDLDCLVRFSAGKINIDNISFTYGDIPYLLSGDIAISPQTFVNLKFSSYPNISREERFRQSNALEIQVAGLIAKEQFSGSIGLDYFDHIIYSMPSHIGATFDNLRFSFDKNMQVRLFSREVKLSYQKNKSNHEVILNNLNVFSHLKSKKIKLSANMYNGFLWVEGVINFTNKYNNLLFNIKVKDVLANHMAGMLSYFGAVFGKLNASAVCQLIPNFFIKGQMAIDKGYIDNLIFFNWIADFFSIDLLRRPDFDQLAISFYLDNNSRKLTNIDLNSKNVRLTGNFGIDSNNLVASKISLGLSRELLDNSPKTRPLLRFMGGGIDFLNFDFQLSGFFNAMNFKWLDSDFRNRLKNMLPGIIESAFEQRVESAVKLLKQQAEEGNDSNN